MIGALFMGLLAIVGGAAAAPKQCTVISGLGPNLNCGDLTKLGTKCYHNWGRDDLCRTGDYIHDIGSATEMNRFKAWSSVKAIQGPNEPNIKRSIMPWADEMSPGAACGLWKQIVRKLPSGAKRLSPGVAYCSAIKGRADKFYYSGCSANHKTWMQEFFKAGCKDLVDVVNLHVYACDVDTVHRFVDEMRTLGKPVWITEIACETNPTKDANIKLMRALQRDPPAVQRWYWVQTRVTAGVARVSHMVDRSGDLVALGRLFRAGTSGTVGGQGEIPVGGSGTGGCCGCGGCGCSCGAAANTCKAL